MDRSTRLPRLVTLLLSGLLAALVAAGCGGGEGGGEEPAGVETPDVEGAMETTMGGTTAVPEVDEGAGS